MRKHHAFNLNNWPRRKSGELIFDDTNEAIYYANLVDDRLTAYDLLKKWRKKAYVQIKMLRSSSTKNYNMLFDLAVRAQLYRECMQEIERLNEADK